MVSVRGSDGGKIPGSKIFFGREVLNGEFKVSVCPLVFCCFFKKKNLINYLYPTVRFVLFVNSGIGR